MKSNRIGRRNRSAFTLMEVLLVMAILVVMASMVTFAFLTIQRNAQSDAAYTNASNLATACKQYKLQVGYFPNTLQDLIVKPEGISQQKWKGPHLDAEAVPMDPWDNEYKYSADEANNLVEIVSAGPDRQMGTDDDISNRQNR